MMQATVQLRLALIAFVALVGVMLVAPSPASASLEHYCDPGDVCMFKASGYNGGIYETPSNNYNYQGGTFGECSWFCNLNDETSSVDNDGRDCNSRHYVGGGSDRVGSASMLLAKGAADSDLSNNAGFNDALSAHKWCA